MGNNPYFQVLTKQSDFQNLKDHGKKHWPQRWLLMSYKKNEADSLRCGWTISRKIGSAVVRNRLKRWCREFFRSVGHSKMDFDINVIFIAPKKMNGKEKMNFKKMKFCEFNESMTLGWQKISSQMAKA